MNSIDIGRAFKAPFEDQNWVTKTLLGLVFGLVFFLAPAITGAMLEYIKKVSQGQEDLPEWSDFGNKWVKGLVVVVAGMIYFLPVWVLGLVFMVPILFAGGADSNALAAVASGGLCLFWILAFIYTIAIAVLFYAAVVNYALTNEFGAFFRFGEILTRVREGSGYWAAWGTTVLAVFVASAISGAIPVVGWLVAGGLTYLASMVGAHALGQWAARSYRPVAAAASVTGFPPAPPAPPTPPVQPAAPATPPAPPAPPTPPVEPTPPATPPAPPTPPVEPVPPATPPAPPVEPEPPVMPPAPPAEPMAPEPSAPPAPPAPEAPPAEAPGEEGPSS